jgi:excisionase family DNA binding protein
VYRGDDSEGLQSVEEVAEYLGMRPTTVYQWCREGRLPALKLGKVWRVRRSALDAFLRQSEHNPTLVGQLRAFLRVPDHVLCIAETSALMHRLDAAFFQVGEASGGLLVKFTAGEGTPDTVLRKEFERYGLAVARLEEEGRMRFSPETDPRSGRSLAIQELLRSEADSGRVIWACFDWTEDVSLEAALKQQEALSDVIAAAALVVNTTVLEETTEEWPGRMMRRARVGHLGTIWLTEAGLSLSRVTPLPST